MNFFSPVLFLVFVAMYFSLHPILFYVLFSPRIFNNDNFKIILFLCLAASPKKKLKIHSSRGNTELANCEFCGILGEKSKFKRSKRFCSISCAKGRKSKRMKQASTEENTVEGITFILL